MTDKKKKVEKYTEINYNQRGIVIGYEKDQKNGLFEWDNVDVLDRTDIKAKQFFEEQGIIIVKKDQLMTDKIKEKAFRNFKHNGIHLTFPNGNVLSTVWGYCTYSDNYDMEVDVDNFNKFLDSDTVEIMILKAPSRLRKKIDKKYDFDGDVKGYLTMEGWLDVVKMLSK